MEVKTVESGWNAKGVSLPTSVCHLSYYIYMCTRQFLDDLETKLCPAGERERDIFLQLKKEEYAERGHPFDEEFYIWDYRYGTPDSMNRAMDRRSSSRSVL